jgi:long-subunit fatty acid transport protein
MLAKGGDAVRKVLFAVGLAALAASAALAQTQLPNPGLQVQFAPPGARALGMGATFVAVADDATAAVSNPAGLIILSRPEVSAQFRYSSFTSTSPFGADLPDSEESIGSVSFASFVYPKKSFALGFFYNQPTNFKAAYNASWTNYDSDIRRDVTETLSSSQSVKFENFGASAAFKLGESVSVGGSIRGTRVSREMSFAYSWSAAVTPPTSVTFKDGASGSPTEVSFGAGVLVNPNGRFSVGANYSYGPEVNIGRTWSVQRSGFFVDPEHPPQESGTDEPSPFNVPDTFGAGFAFRPTDKWVIAAEVLGVKYSDLEIKTTEGDVAELQFDDKAEFHVGAEYTLMSGKTPVSLRAGYFYDPDHDGVGDQDGDGIEDLDTTQHHVTFGAGFVANNKVQVDFAANIAKYVKEALVSVVIRF